MIRQIFIAPVKEGVTEEEVQTRIAEMRKFRESRQLPLIKRLGCMEYPTRL